VIRRTLDHAPSNTPATPRSLCDLIGPYRSLHITASAYSLCLRPAADRPKHPGNQWNSRSRAADRECYSSLFIPNKILGEEGHTNLVPQAAPAYSNATECFHRIRRAFSIRLLACCHSARTSTIATK